MPLAKPEAQVLSYASNTPSKASRLASRVLEAPCSLPNIQPTSEAAAFARSVADSFKAPSGVSFVRPVNQPSQSDGVSTLSQ
jgi:hypothetical protein